jgi:hypothetical protein
MASVRNTFGSKRDHTPRLYATERIGFEEKVIHKRYVFGVAYWLIAEQTEDVAFGFADLGNPDFAEWGYISITELLDNGASLDEDWKPCTFSEAKARIESQ